MKHRNKFLLLLLCLSLLLGTVSCGGRPSQDTDKAFSDFIDELWRENVNLDTLTLHYSLARPQDFGITPCETTLGSFKQQEITDSVKESKTELDALHAYSYADLTKNEQLLYDCTERALEYSIKINSYPYYAEPLGPSTGLQAELPIVLAEYHFYNKADVETYLALLKCMPDYFNDIAAYEREKSAAGYFMADSVADKIIDQCKAFIETPEKNLLIECFSAQLKELDELSADERILYEEQNRETVLAYVIPAYQTLIDTLTALKGTGKLTGGLASLPDGAAYFEALAQSETGSSKTVKQMKKELTSAVKKAILSMSTAQIADGKLFERYQNLSYPTDDPAEGLILLKDASKTDFPPLADVDYSVKYVHESLQDFLSPAMYLIPPFDDRHTNHIYINSGSDSRTDSLFTTLAHEGYPGHLYQNNYFLDSNPSPLLHLLRTRGYTEGWGTYAEFYGYKLAGFDDLLATFLQDNMTAILCLYGLTEIGLHAEGWTKEDTVSFWSGYGIGEEAATEIYETILAEPCSYLPYCIGYLEFGNLKDEAKKILGDAYTELAFHTYVLDIGPVPFAIIEKRMKEELK